MGFDKKALKCAKKFYRQAKTQAAIIELLKALPFLYNPHTVEALIALKSPSGSPSVKKSQLSNKLVAKHIDTYLTTWDPSSATNALKLLWQHILPLQDAKFLKALLQQLRESLTAVFIDYDKLNSAFMSPDALNDWFDALPLLNSPVIVERMRKLSPKVGTPEASLPNKAKLLETVRAIIQTTDTFEETGPLLTLMQLVAPLSIQANIERFLAELNRDPCRRCEKFFKQVTQQKWITLIKQNSLPPSALLPVFVNQIHLWVKPKRQKEGDSDRQTAAIMKFIQSSLPGDKAHLVNTLVTLMLHSYPQLIPYLIEDPENSLKANTRHLINYAWHIHRLSPDTSDCWVAYQHLLYDARATISDCVSKIDVDPDSGKLNETEFLKRLVDKKVPKLSERAEQATKKTLSIYQQHFAVGQASPQSTSSQSTSPQSASSQSASPQSAEHRLPEHLKRKPGRRQRRGSFSEALRKPLTSSRSENSLRNQSSTSLGSPSSTGVLSPSSRPKLRRTSRSTFDPHGYFKPTHKSDSVLEKARAPSASSESTDDAHSESCNP